MKTHILNLDENFTSSIRVFLCWVNPREQKHFKDHLLTPHDKQARHIGQGGVFFPQNTPIKKTYCGGTGGSLGYLTWSSLSGYYF
jgi:hypothetical protein